MWLTTTLGFFSAVCAREGDGKLSRAVDPDRIMVRAREVAHLENLRERFPRQMKDAEVYVSKGTDYPARVFLPKKTWAGMVRALVEDVDYDNFKSAVGREKKTEPEYVSALHRVWSVFREFQSTLLRKETAAKLRTLTRTGTLPFKRGVVKLAPGETPASHDAMIEAVQVHEDEEAAILSVRVGVGDDDAIPVALLVGGLHTPEWEGDDGALLSDLGAWGIVGDIEEARVRVDRLPWGSIDSQLHELPVFDLDSDCLYED